MRGLVALVGVVSTRLAAGTHYDVSPLTEVGVAFSDQSWTFVASSWEQIFWLTLLPQLVIWPAFTVLAGAVLVLVAGGMTYHGLAWLDARVDLAPDWMLVAAAFGLSGLNVVSLYVFAREIPRKREAPRVIEAPTTLAARELANRRWNQVA